MEWATVAELGTASGTLVLAVATFASVRSANRTARLAERSLLDQIRPLMLPSGFHDHEQKIGFMDGHWVHLPGGQGTAEVAPEGVYLTMSLRNAGSGLAVLLGWRLIDRHEFGDVGQPDPADFHRHGRDIYVPPATVGFWQGALRDPNDGEYARIADVVKNRQPFMVDLLYGDGDGGQRVISRFTMTPMRENGWLVASARHWHIDRESPR
jgi:hypothetical protein